MLDNTSVHSDSANKLDSKEYRSKQHLADSKPSMADGNIVRPELKLEDAISSFSGPLPCESAGTDSISIIVVNHDAGSMLTDCIDSALNQAKEIIVVDNASSDDSIERLESAFPNNSKLTIIKNKKNLGFAKACNIGSRVAKGNYLMFLNPDCLLQEGCVDNLISSLQGNPDAAMAGGLLLNPDGTEQGGGRRAVPTPWRSFVRGFGLSRLAHRWPKLFFDYHLHKQPLPDEPIDVEAISGACMMIRRETLEQVGFWDEGYFLHCEDLDLCMQLRRKEWKILFVPDAPAIHYLGLCSRNKPIFVEWHKHKGMIRFYRKYFRHQYPGFLIWLVSIGVWTRFSLIVLYYSIHGKKAYLKPRHA